MSPYQDCPAYFCLDYFNPHVIRTEDLLPMNSPNFQLDLWWDNPYPLTLIIYANLEFDDFAMKTQSGSANVEQRLSQMLSKLKDRDFRITPQRLAVLKVLAASEGHPSVERVYETVRAEFPTTSLATIYKTVNLLKQLNEVLELGFPDGSNRYDGNKPYPHPHLICTKCKQIIDPDLGSLEELKREVVKQTGFQVLTHRVDFFGICRDCQKRIA